MNCLQELWNVRRLAGAGATNTNTSNSNTLPQQEIAHDHNNAGQKWTQSRPRVRALVDSSITHNSESFTADDNDDTDLQLNLSNPNNATTTINSSFLSNHVRVNQEREQRGMELLTRCSILDEMAREKAHEMAAQQCLLKAYQSETLVEYVTQTTSSLQLLHQLTMHGLDNVARDCILSPQFVRFGMGTARGKDGQIYVSQLFQGTPFITKESASSGEEEAATEEPTTTTTEEEHFTQRIYVPSYHSTDQNTNISNQSNNNIQTNTAISTEEKIQPNPTTRVIPTLDIHVNPILLQTKSRRSRSRRPKLLNDSLHKQMNVSMSSTITTRISNKQAVRGVM